ncbi:MAG: site-specific integrase [Candidatus Azobacteroides sp.]|nr:site-specific integrase [Candidatus Azobacteroides sp.]
MKHSVKFDLLPNKVKGDIAGCMSIRMRVSYAGKRPDLLIGYSIEPEKWNKETMRAVPGTKNKFKQSANEINKAIAKNETWIDEFFTKFELLENRTPNESELKDAHKIFLGKEVKRGETKQDETNPVNFYHIYDKYINEQSLLNSWSKSHKNRHQSIKNVLMEYKPDLSFNDVTKEMMISFLNHLFNGDLCNTTISKILSLFRNFLYWASGEGYYTGNQHIKFKPKLKGSDGSHKAVIYLTWDELITLYNLKFPAKKRYLEHVRDVFCFCCFTGLRYSDAFNLSKADVQKERISVITQKTVDPLYIELNEYSTALLKKYESYPIDKALPVISNQKMNEYIKELGELAGFTTPTKLIHFKNNERIEEIYPKYKVLSTHCGRRTFIVLALTLGIPLAVIMKWTGHKSYASMKPYIKIVDSLKEEEMKKFNKKISEPDKLPENELSN